MNGLSSGPIQLSFLLPPRILLPRSSIRHASVETARRTTKRLRVKPDKAVRPSRSATSAAPAHDHIVFNPPSSAPSPLQTPPIFLPRNDPRRQLLAKSHAHENPYATGERAMPPPLRQQRGRKHHLTAEQIEEIRALRAADPFEWTRAKLAKRFGCTEFFVGMCAQAPKERMDWAKKQLEAVKQRWGPRRANAREERTKRREMWARDE